MPVARRRRATQPVLAWVCRAPVFLPVWCSSSVRGNGIRQKSWLLSQLGAPSGPFGPIIPQ